MLLILLTSKNKIEEIPLCPLVLHRRLFNVHLYPLVFHLRLLNVDGMISVPDPGLG